ncbi:MAG TPA: ATP synthase F1 subunit gamma [Thermoanaerobaculia bacterium]|nr:ATP synthase F1 subunit gamma [Thermoanaerobaculia bacterium]
MASLIDIRRRLRSVKSTQQITKAMKMVAAAKLRRAQERVVGARPYAKLLSNVLASVTAKAGEVKHPLLAVREERRVIVVVIAGDRGLCGAFNTNVHRAAQHLIAAHPEWTEVRVLPAGKKAVEFWKRRKFPLTEKTYPAVFANLRYADAREIATDLSEEFLAEKVDAVYVVVNEFRSILSQVVQTSRLLPLTAGETAEAPAAAAAREAPADAGVEYIYEPDAKTILAWLLPRSLEFAVYRALAESAAAEMGARMTAMDSAQKNAGEIIDKLTLTYNRARQARITKELIEIVSGAAALE